MNDTDLASLENELAARIATAGDETILDGGGKLDTQWLVDYKFIEEVKYGISMLEEPDNASAIIDEKSNT